MFRVDLIGRDTGFDCAEDDTLMRAAIRAGLGFPYECNVGSCGNCRFELVEGSVEHLRQDAPGLSDRDRARNRWLGCQSRPLSDCRIKVNPNPRYLSLHAPRRTHGTLVETVAITHDIREFRFRLDENLSYLPGQYALLGIPGVEGARAYSMCGIDTGDSHLSFQIRRVPDGAATTALFERLAPGDRIQIDGPYGMAWLREDAPRDVICLAGGSGLSPMVSIARGAAASAALSGQRIHFIYGGRTPRDICGESILAALPGWGRRILYYPSVSTPEDACGETWTGRRGFVHEVAAEIFGADLARHEIYFAGPPAMAAAVQTMLHDLAVPPAQVHFDQFF